MKRWKWLVFSFLCWKSFNMQSRRRGAAACDETIRSDDGWRVGRNLLLLLGFISSSLSLPAASLGSAASSSTFQMADGATEVSANRPGRNTQEHSDSSGSQEEEEERRLVLLFKAADSAVCFTQDNWISTKRDVSVKSLT